jgi:hypothetical protein
VATRSRQAAKGHDDTDIAEASPDTLGRTEQGLFPFAAMSSSGESRLV